MISKSQGMIDNVKKLQNQAQQKVAEIDPDTEQSLGRREQDARQHVGKVLGDVDQATEQNMGLLSQGRDESSMGMGSISPEYAEQASRDFGDTREQSRLDRMITAQDEKQALLQRAAAGADVLAQQQIQKFKAEKQRALVNLQAQLDKKAKRGKMMGAIMGLGGTALGAYLGGAGGAAAGGKIGGAAGEGLGGK